MTLNLFNPFYSPLSPFFTPFETTILCNTSTSRTVIPNYTSHLSKSGRQVIELELPGVKKEDIQLELLQDGRVISVIAKRYRKEDDDDKKVVAIYKWKGRVYGKTKKDDVTAEYTGDGILKVIVKECKDIQKPIQVDIQDA